MLRMRSLVILAILAIGAVWWAAIGCGAARAQPNPASTGELPVLHVGVAESIITPPEKFPIAGYYHERLATGTLDPLKAKALVWRQGDVQAALVVCDLTGIAVDLSTEVRTRVARLAGIPFEHITVAATHSHTAPDYGRDLFEHLADPEKSVGADGPYTKQLLAAIVEAIQQAQARAAPALLECGTAQQQEPVSFNRRFVMTDGSVKTWQRLDHPQVVRAAGPIDPELGLVLVRSSADRRPLGVLTSFALHLDTVGGTMWSADYPFYIERSLRAALGPDVVSIFGLGCCGDINHSDPTRTDRNKTDYIGNSLGQTASAALPGLQAVETPRLQVRRAVVRLPLQTVTPEQLAAARPLLLDARAGGKVDFFEHVAAYKAIVLEQLQHAQPRVPAADLINWGLSHHWRGVGDHLPVEVQTVTVGSELAIVALPGEVFVELGLAIKRGSPYRTTLIVELSNCVETMYIPTRAAYAGGSYEVLNSATQPGSGEMLVEAALRLLRESASANMGPEPRP